MAQPLTDNSASADGFVTVGVSAMLPANQMKAVLVNGRRYIVARWQEGLYAFHSQCPHAGANLADGDYYKGKIECPDHLYCFDVRTGRILWPEDEVYRLKMVLVKEEAGKIKLKLP